MNRVVLIGNLCKEITVRYTQENKAVGNFTLGVRRDNKNSNGQYESDFISCNCFGSTAEYLQKYTKKGSRISVEGSIRTRNYDGQDGKKVYVTEVKVDHVENLTPREDGQANETESDKQVPQNEFENISVKTEVQQQFEYDESILPF